MEIRLTDISLAVIKSALSTLKTVRTTQNILKMLLIKAKRADVDLRRLSPFRRDLSEAIKDNIDILLAKGVRTTGGIVGDVLLGGYITTSIIIIIIISGLRAGFLKW